MDTKNAVVFLAEGFEEVETITVVDVLRRAGINCKLISITEETCINGAHDIKVFADEPASKMPVEADIVILPGGGLGTENLMKSDFVKQKLTEFYNNKKWLAAVCAAPTVFEAHGFLKGKTAVCYPSCESSLNSALLGKDDVEVCENIITSKAPGTSAKFALKIVEILLNEETAKKIKTEMLF